MITIIDRCEQKYFLNNQQFKKVMQLLEDRLEKDKYFSETIYNIYFDNDNYELINRSMDKPDYKEKVRLRSYEKNVSNKNIFLEIKKKYESITNKRRIIIKYEDFINYLDNGIVPNCDRQIMREIDYCFRRYQLKPKIKIRYDRLSYYLKGDEGFRITFDNNVCYNLDNLSFSKDDGDKLLFHEGYIMEIKSFSGLPLWLNKILTELNIFPTSFSKVGKVIENKGVI